MQDFKACVGADASVRPMSSREFPQHSVGADAHIGPLGSYEFAAEFRKKRCILPGQCVPASGRPTSVTLLCRERL